MTVDMSDFDKSMAVFSKQEQIARKMLARNMSPEEVAEVTDIPLYLVREILTIEFQGNTVKGLFLWLNIIPSSVRRI